MSILKSISLFYLLGSFGLAQDTSLAAVKRAVDNANIPVDAHIVFQPNTLLEVTFPQASGPSVNVHAGIQLPRNSTAIPPTFAVRDGRLPAHERFVIAMVDLDAPTPQDPTSAQIRHFLGSDFVLRGSGTETQRLFNATPALSNFLQPTPPAGSDPHRYVFLLFGQPPGFDEQTLVNSTTSVANFNVSQFAQEVGLGNPLGGTFILVGPDPSI